MNSPVIVIVYKQNQINVDVSFKHNPTNKCTNNSFHSRKKKENKMRYKSSIWPTRGARTEDQYGPDQMVVPIRDGMYDRLLDLAVGGCVCAPSVVGFSLNGRRVLAFPCRPY